MMTARPISPHDIWTTTTETSAYEAPSGPAGGRFCRSRLLSVAYTDSMRAQDLAKAKALEWMRRRHQHVWQRFVDEAYAELGIERRPVGRPKAK